MKIRCLLTILAATAVLCIALGLLWLYVHVNRTVDTVDTADTVKTVVKEESLPTVQPPVLAKSRFVPTAMPPRNIASVDKPELTVVDTLQSIPVTPQRWAVLQETLADQITSDVAAVVGWGERSEPQRNLVRQLGTNLSDVDRKVLSAFLDLPFSEQRGTGNLAFNALKNDVLGKLLQQNVIETGFGFYLVRMYKDERLDDVWRDYCIQFVSAYWNRRCVLGAWQPDEKQALLDACRHAATCVDIPVAGTALLTLCRIAEESPNSMESPVPISDIAVGVARNENACNAARATAIQVCARLNRRDILSLCRKLAVSPGDVTLRMSAIAALGSLGDRSSLAAIQSLSTSSEPRISLAARGALHCLAATD